MRHEELLENLAVSLIVGAVLLTVSLQIGLLTQAKTRRAFWWSWFCPWAWFGGLTPLGEALRRWIRWFSVILALALAGLLGFVWLFLT